jgi:hypothetical protein
VVELIENPPVNQRISHNRCSVFLHPTLTGYEILTAAELCVVTFKAVTVVGYQRYQLKVQGVPRKTGPTY